MKLTPTLTQEIFLRVKEQCPNSNITKKDIENAAISPVDIYDQFRLKEFEKVLMCQLDYTHMHKMVLMSKLLVYLYVENDNTPLVFIVRIVKDK